MNNAEFDHWICEFSKLSCCYVHTDTDVTYVFVFNPDIGANSSAIAW